MGRVSFDGTTQGYLCFGGIVGYPLCSSSYTVYLKNCANYGGNTWEELWMNKWKYIQNCANYGSIIHDENTTGGLLIGGITGYSQSTIIENCVSAGKIVISCSQSTIYSGSIVGYVTSNATINYCYYTSDVGITILYGTNSKLSSTETPTTSSLLNSSLVGNLNTQATENGWNKRLLLHLNGSSINMTQETIAVTGKHFPDSVREGNPFLLLYEDIDCTVEYDPKPQTYPA